MSARQATYVELNTILGVQDMYDILEVIIVDAANQKLINDHVAKQVPK